MKSSKRFGKAIAIAASVTVVVIALVWVIPTSTDGDLWQRIKSMFSGTSHQPEPAESYNKPTTKIKKSDTKFAGAFGIFTETVGTADDVIRSAVVQSDFKILVAGRAGDSSGNDDLMLARFHPDGSLDTGFDSDGKVVYRVSPDNDAIGHAVTIDPSGRIVIVGRAWTNSNYNFMVARYLSNGQPDTSFDSDGFVFLDWGNHEFGRGVVTQSDGKIIAVGYGNQVGNYEVLAARLRTDGSLDNTFNGTGQQTISVSTDFDIVYDVDLLSDGSIVMAGKTVAANEDVLVVKLDTDGTPSNGFGGSNGFRTFDIQGGNDVAYSILVNAADRIIVGGKSHDGSQNDYFLGRFRGNNGNPDNQFGTSGFTTTNVSSGAIVRGINFDNNENILAAGRVWNGSNWDFGLARYHSNGILDTAFGVAGIRISTIGSGEDTALAGAYRDEHIFAIGRSDNGTNYDLALARYNSTGTLADSGDLDQNFNSNGSQIQLSPLSASATAYNVNPTSSEGKFVLTGNWDNGLAAMRVNADGTLDTSFSTDGKATRIISGMTSTFGLRGYVQSDDKVLGIGYTNTIVWGIARFNQDGNIDTTFNAGAGDISFTPSGLSVGIAVTEDSLGRIVGAGSANLLTDFAVARLTSNGTLDSNFNTTGMRVLNVQTSGDEYFWDVTTDSNNRIIGVGPSGTDFFVARFNTNGANDTTFNTTGIRTIDDGSTEVAYKVAIDSQNRILVAGTRNNDFGVARLLSDGSSDTSFDTDGFASANFGFNEVAYGLDFQANGKIVLTGGASSRWAATRFHENGALDTEFATNGILRLGTVTTFVFGGAIQMDGRIGLGGYAVSGGNNLFVMSRQWP